MNKRGFSLIEVMIGLVILAIGLLAIAGMLITSVRGNSFSNNLTQASYVAMERLEYLRGLSLIGDQLTLGPHSEGPTTPNFSGLVFNRAYTVETHSAGKKITYTVTWNDGANHTVKFSTIRSQ